MSGKFYVVKVVGGQEKSVASSLMKKTELQKLPIYSIVVNDKMKGYLIIEAENPGAVGRLINDVKNVRSQLPGVLSNAEIQSMIKVSKVEISFNQNDIVEVINGPFKGMKAKIIRFDKDKREASITLLDTPVQIQVTIDASYLKASQ